MDQGVAAVIAAGVAGVVGVTGSFIGVWVGRRQVRDQAQVEHGQWLRGQRQEAYVAFLAAWDEMLRTLRDRVPDEEQMSQLDNTRGWDEALRLTREAMGQDVLPVLRAAERVRMLGPEPVEMVIVAMLGNAVAISHGVEAHFVGRGDAGSLDAYREAEGQAAAHRRGFLERSSQVLRQAPDTKRL